MELSDMVMSMTGYGRSIMHIDDSDITVEIRSVNNRFADVSVKLPRSLTYCEDKVKTEVLKKVNRGKIDELISKRALEEIYLPAFKACVK